MPPNDVNIRISGQNISRKAFLEAVRDITGVNEAAEKTGPAVNKSSLSVGRLAASLGLAGLGLQALRSGMRFAGDAAIGLNAQLETTELQFATLIGNSSRAEQHVASLFDFAKRTPFETGPIIEASRQMRVFGGHALDTRAHLQLIGDASAATSAPIQELGRWTGRLYSQLQSGKPFGEAAQRLQEMAVLTPQARAEMEDLQKSGGDAAAVFEVFTGALGQFEGAMVKQANTFSGLTSTFWDNTQLFIASRSTPAFELLKDVIGSANDAMEKLSSEGFERVTHDMETALQQLQFAQRDANDQFERYGIVQSFYRTKLADAKAAVLDLKEKGLVEAINAGKDLNDVFTTIGGVTAVRLEGAFESLVASGGLTADQMVSIGQKADQLRENGQTLTIGLERLADAYRNGSLAGDDLSATTLDVAASTKKAEEETVKLLDGIEKQVDKSKALEAAMAALMIPMQGVTGSLRDTVPLTTTWSGHLEGLEGDIEAVTIRTIALADATEGLGTQFDRPAPLTFFQTLADGIEDELGNLDLGGLIVGAFAGGGDVGRTIGGGLGNALGSGLSGALTGENGPLSGSRIGGLLGGALGPLGALGGGLLGGLFDNIGGPSEAEQAARGIVESFEQELIRGLSASQLAEAEGERWRQVTIAVRDMFVEAERSAQDGVDAVGRLWAAIQDGGPAAVAEAIAAIRMVEVQIDLNAEAAAAAAEAREEELAGLASQRAAVLESFDEQRSRFDEMGRIAEEYGISLHSLGSSFKRAEIEETALRIVNDFNLMRDEGANVTAVLEGMADEVQEVVTRSRQFGTTIPLEMQPMIAKLIEMGELTDENGEKLTDVSQLSWSESLTGAIQDVVDKLDEVIAAIKGDDGVIDALGDIPDEVNTTVRVRVDDSELRNLPGGTGELHLEGFASGTDIRNFGPRGTMAVLHNDEAVVDRPHFPNLAAEIAALMPAAGGDIYLNVADGGAQRLTREQFQEIEQHGAAGRIHIPAAAVTA